MKVLLIILGVLVGLFAILGIIALIKKPSSVYANQPEELNPMQGKKVVFVYDDNDVENADGVRGHLEAVGDSEPKKSAYNFWKRLFDIVLSFGALVALSPLFLGLSLAIFLNEDRGISGYENRNKLVDLMSV